MLSSLMDSLLAKTVQVFDAVSSNAIAYLEPTTSTSNDVARSTADVERPRGGASATGLEVEVTSPAGRGLPRDDSLDNRFEILKLGSFTETLSMGSRLDSEEQSSSRGERVSSMLPRGTSVQSVEAKATKGPSKSNFAISIPALEDFLTVGLGADSDALRTSFDQSESRNNMASELLTRKTIIERRIKNMIDPEQKFPLREDNEADGWELEASQTSLIREIGTRGSETETLQRIIVQLQREAANTLADRDATIQQLAADKKELAAEVEKVNKELEDSNAEHAREINVWKVKYYEAVSSHQQDAEAATKEIQRLKASLKDFAERAEEHLVPDSGETAVGSETAETPDKSKVRTWLRKRLMDSDDLDNADSVLGKRARPHSESTRGRSKVRSFRKGFIKSFSRTRTPEAKYERGGEGKHVAEDGVRETAGSSPIATKGTYLRSSEDDVVFAPRLLQTPDNKTLHALGSIAASSSTGSSNNADDEATLAGTPTSARKVNGHEDVFLDSATAPSDPKTNVGTLNERNLSREPSLNRKHPEAGPQDSPTPVVSPTPVQGSRKSSPFASDSPIRAMGSRALSPLNEALQPILQAASASFSNKRKLEEEWEKPPPSPPVFSWYAQAQAQAQEGRPTKKAKPGHPGPRRKGRK